MIEPTIHGLSNEQYHHEAPYSKYLSSSQLKLYGKSPRHAKFMLDNPVEEKSETLRFGSLFHDCMAAMAEGASLCEVLDAIEVFEPPVNKSTGKPYGPTSNPYKEAYETFASSMHETLISTAEERDLVSAMLNSLLYGSGSTSEQVRKLLKWGKPEVSHFIEYQGCKFKWRPDLETRKKIVDWKSTTTDDLSEESLNRIILKYGYHISAPFYQFFTHEQTGVWKDFYIVFVSKVPPYDSVMVDMANYGYRYLPDADIVISGCGAMEFKRLLDLRIKCTKEVHWPGAENNIPDNNGVRVLEITPPRYYERKFFDEI